MKRVKWSLVVTLSLLMVASTATMYGMGPFSKMKGNACGPKMHQGKMVAGQPALNMMVEGLGHLLAKVTHGENGHREIKSLLKLSDELKLTDEQITKLRTLDLEHQKTVIRKKAAAAEALAEMENILTQATPDKMKLSYKNLEVMGAVADITESCFEVNLEVKSLLSAKQNKALNEISAKMKAAKSCGSNPDCSMKQKRMGPKGPGHMMGGK